MDAGRELDALVAEKIFGYTLDYEFADLHIPPAPHVKELRDQYDEWGLLPEYSTDIAAAWQVVEAMDRWGWMAHISRRIGGWECRFTPSETERYVFESDETAPLAICHAALSALGVDA